MADKKEVPASATVPKPVAAVNDDQLYGLPRGEYMVHVFIEETRGIKNPKAEDETVDPIIEIKTFGKTRYTKVQKGVGSGATFWGEHFFFEKSFQTSFELENEKILITVSDHKALGFKSVIGSVEFNVPTVYFKEKHCLIHQWAALSGLTKKFQEVLGFIKFSIGVFAAGDEQVVLNEEKAIDVFGGTNKLNVLYPPQITTTPYQIRIKVFRGEKLKKMDTFGKVDPYCQVVYGGLEIKNTILKLNYDPIWNEEFFVPASLPTINEKVLFRLFDWDSGTADELMGTVQFNIKDIMENKYKQPFWVNIYGAHTDAKKEYEKMFNEIPSLATEWKGRVQLALSMKEELRPVLNFAPMTDAVTKPAEVIKREVFELRAEIHYALNLRKNDEDYILRVRWGSAEVTTKKKTSKNRMIEFYESIALSSDFPYGVLPDSEIPDIFVYLNNGSKDISFIRRPWKDFSKQDMKAAVFYFNVNKGLTDTRDDLSGIVKMRLLAFKPSEKPNLSLYGWDRPIQKIQPKTGWKVHFNIYQAKDLMSGDSSGLSDPYLNIYHYGAEQKTTTIEETLNPIWNERLEFVTAFDQVGEASPFILTMWDKDQIGSDDFIGSAIINVDPTHLNPTELPEPKWYDLRFGKSHGSFGKILLSVCCYTRQDLIPRSPYIEPDSVRYYINMKILGLRDLESTGLLPIKRAYVRFDVDSLKSQTHKSLLREKKFIKTEPLNPGPNPNILTVINLDLELPSNPEYCPSMSCGVFDYIFRGMSQPVIGNFSIPLGDLIKETSREVERRVKKLSDLYYATQEIQTKIDDQKSKETKRKTPRIPEFPVEEGGIQESDAKPLLGLGSPEERKASESDRKDQTEKLLETSGDPLNKTPPGGLLGRFTGSLAKKFEAIKIEKGALPGEDDQIKINIMGEDEDEDEDDHDHEHDSPDRNTIQNNHKAHVPKDVCSIHDAAHDITDEARASKNFVMKPKYRKNADKGKEEYGRPDLTKYRELGFNNKEGTHKKHYRFCVDGELEKSEYIDASPFMEIPIFRGKRVTEDTFFKNFFGKTEDYKCVGHFKAMVTVMNEFDKMKYDAKLAHVGTVAQTKGLEFSDDEFLRRRDVVVRLYIIEAEGLNDLDEDSNSDPYLIVKLGRVEYNEKKFYQNDTSDPKFNKCFEFPATLPGASKLSIQLWDYDRLDADDLIGKTEIDIEDRWYSSKWRSLKHVPIETRQLYHPSSKISQGSIKLWVEILPKDDAKIPVWHIAPKPQMDFELRVIVWECKDVPNVDIEDATDIYITGKLSTGQEYRTDTHFRSMNGKGSFNWRMVFPVSLPMKKHRISFQIWDKDLLTANDYISEATFDFDTEALRAFEHEEIVNLSGSEDSQPKFWVPCSNTKIIDGKAVQEDLGSILISMAIVPKALAEKAPVGQGRANPNQNPFLPPPEGRFEWTWNVIKLWKQLVGPLATEKIATYASICCCVLIAIMVVPLVIANTITKVF